MSILIWIALYVLIGVGCHRVSLQAGRCTKSKFDVITVVVAWPLAIGTEGLIAAIDWWKS